MHSCTSTELSNPATRLSLMLVVALLAPLPVQAAALGSYNIDPNEVSVSGLSSGGFMAVQMHVAYSGTFRKGVGVVAGGAFYCAQDNQTQALNNCMDAQLYGTPSLSTLISTTDNWATSGYLDATGNMAGSKVWLFTGGRTDSGTRDTTVDWRVMDQLQSYYQNYTSSSNIFYKSNLPAEHAMPTDHYGKSCATHGDPFINNCGYDAAGAILQHIHGTLNAKNTSPSNANIVQFDQNEFIASPTAHGMWSTGYAYVPSSCAGGALCKLHVVFHGCKQYPGWSYFDSALGGMTTIGDKYVKNTGYNRWADTNNTIVLYPQANAMTSGTRSGKSNPNGCWDWWGYDDINYAKKSGRQMAAVKGMVDRIMGGAGGGPAAPTDLGVTGATNNSVSLAWSASGGPDLAGYNVYRNSIKVNGSLVTTTGYTDSGLASGTTYSYFVKAVDTGSAESAASNTVNATTTGGATMNFSSIPGDDGYVKATADGSAPAVGAFSTPAIGRGSDAKYNRTLLSFDTSAIPDSATVTRAYLTVTYSSSSGDPWASPSGNTLVIDVKTGTFGAATTETSDYAAAPSASAAANIARFTGGSKQSSDFGAAGLTAINKTGKTQLKLRFNGNQGSTAYVFIAQGAGATLTVVYQ